jgi:hypothetical protein
LRRVRWLQMSYDEVCTSDPDELEIVLAKEPDYWWTKPPSPQVTDNTSIRLPQTPLPSSQPSDDSPRPRKRMKVSPVGPKHSGVAEDNYVSAT